MLAVTSLSQMVTHTHTSWSLQVSKSYNLMHCLHLCLSIHDTGEGTSVSFVSLSLPRPPGAQPLPADVGSGDPAAPQKFNTDVNLTEKINRRQKLVGLNVYTRRAEIN